MKILHILSQTPDFTGSGKYIQEIIHQCDKNGHQNYLVAGTPSDFSLPESVIKEKNTVLVRFNGEHIDFPIAGMSDVMPYKSSRFSSLSEDQLFSYNQVFTKKIQTAIDLFKPDIVHSHHLWIVSAISKSLLKNIPQVTTCHGSCLRQHYLCPQISEKIVRKLQQIDKVIALSIDQKVKMNQKIQIDSDKIEIVSGGFNQNNFYLSSKSENGLVEMLYAGKLSVAKGVPWLLKSLEKIKEMPFVLHIAGSSSGKEKQLCLALAQKLGSKVQYHGPLSHQKLGELMRQCHIFVLPSFYEGVPLVLMEALACGCKIAATSLPGVKQIFGNYIGDQVQLIKLPELETIDKPYKKDIPALEDDLSKVLKSLIEKVIADPQPNIKDINHICPPYSWSKIFKKVEKIYEDLTTEI